MQIHNVIVTSSKFNDRLAARKFYCTSKSGIFNFKVGDQFRILDNAEIQQFSASPGGRLLFSIGSFSYSWSELPPNTRVGRYCSIARGLSFFGTHHPYQFISSSSFTYDKGFPIFKNANEIHGNKFKVRSYDKKHGWDTLIGNDVWIGRNVTMKPGIKIGNGAVIAANSVVTKDVPAFSVIGGNPAKFIKHRFPEQLAERIQAAAWWNYGFFDFGDLTIEQPEAFLDGLQNLIDRNAITPFQPAPLTAAEIITFATED